MNRTQEGLSRGSSRTNAVKNVEEKRTTTRKFMMLNEKNDVNKLAEDFIKNFQKQLQLQRDESFKHFQEMINRGA